MKLNLGCGWDVKDVQEGWINHDVRRHSPKIDVAWDLNVLPWPWEDEQFEFILARSVLEHLRITLLDSVNECWRLLRPGGRMRIKVPYWKHDFAWRDPTHYWQFSLRTLDIFDPDTRYGRRYSFYTDRKWTFVQGPKLNHAESSIIAVMEVVK